MAATAVAGSMAATGSTAVRAASFFMAKGSPVGLKDERRRDRIK